MNYLRHLNGFFERLAVDKRLSSYHISLYLALFRQWNACRFNDLFVVSRSEMMELSRIGSANTYARCMKELTDWGYIHYKASSNLHCGSIVSCIRLDTEVNLATGTEPGTGSKSDTTDYPVCNPLPNTDLPSGIKTDTAWNTGTSGSIRNDTASDTGITSGLKTDMATGTGSHENNPAGIKSGTGGDTASDTLLINITKNNKQEKNQEKNQKEKEENPKEKEKRGNEGIQKNDFEEKMRIPDFSQVASFFSQYHFSENEARPFYARYQSSGWKIGDNQKIISWQALARKWMTNNTKNNSHERTFNQIGAGRFSVPTDKDYSEPL